MSEWVASDAGAGIGINQGLVEISLFIGSQCWDDLTIWPNLVATEHEAKKTVQGDKVGAESVISIFGVNDFGQIKWVDADIGVETKADITTAYGVAELLIFIFWVDDDNFGANHHGTHSFKFDSERFTSTRFREDHEVGVFQAKAIEDNQTVIVHVDTIQNSLFLGEVS